ncbi:hypothetical protein ACFL2Q_17365 [Thermodesulfobacteriota bacterium]
MTGWKTKYHLITIESVVFNYSARLGRSMSRLTLPYETVVRETLVTLWECALMPLSWWHRHPAVYLGGRDACPTGSPP